LGHNVLLDELGAVGETEAERMADAISRVRTTVSSGAAAPAAIRAAFTLPQPVVSEGRSGFPTGATTGLTGVALKPGDLTRSGGITTSRVGQIIELADISGGVKVNHDNVTIRKCRVTDTSFFVVDTAGTSGVVVEDCDIDGAGDSGGQGYVCVRGPAHITRCNIWNAENPISPAGGSNVTVLDSYIHTFRSPAAEPHYDGIEALGGESNYTVEHCTIDLDQGDTGAINFSNVFGGFSDITINNCRLLGGGYTMYFDGSHGASPFTGIVITNNRLGSGFFGYAVLRDWNPAELTWAGNVDDITGEPILNPGVS
jgi:hypothetical protein